MRTILTFIMLVALAACVSDRRYELHDQVAAYGLDYTYVRNRAVHLEDARRLFCLLSLLTDGAGSELYSSDLAWILDQVGDDEFLRTLQSTREPIRTAVQESLLYSAGFGEHDESWRAFQLRHPNVADFITRSPAPAADASAAAPAPVVPGVETVSETNTINLSRDSAPLHALR